MYKHKFKLYFEIQALKLKTVLNDFKFPNSYFIIICYFLGIQLEISLYLIPGRSKVKQVTSKRNIHHKQAKSQIESCILISVYKKTDGLNPQFIPQKRRHKREVDRQSCETGISF